MRTTHWHNSLELIVPPAVAEAMKEHPDFAQHTRRRWGSWQQTAVNNNAPEYFADFLHFDESQLRLISGMCHELNEVKMEKTVQAIINFDRPIPGFEPAYNVVYRWLQHHCPTGWVYHEGRDGVYWPYLITTVSAHIPDRHDRHDRPSFTVTAYAKALDARDRDGRHVRGATKSISMTLTPKDVTRKKVATIFEKHGWLLETPELKKAYENAHAYAKKTIEGKLGEQFRLMQTDGALGRKCILDTSTSDYDKELTDRDTYLCAGTYEDFKDDTRPMPMHPEVRIFMLDIHEFQTVRAGQLEPYVYSPGLIDKLILPESHMNMLDILTSDLDAFMSDVIEGKKAGNIILCKGIPGIGKTMTAEIYSEVTRRPIYNVHSGALGTNPAEVEKSLRRVFDRVLRWDCILLLDEADVFVGVRGNDLVQNAIVSVFLRVLEYFGGLMFMTTNRSDNIDDALISRCAAIIDYGVPDRADTMAIWHSMAAQQGVTLPDSLVQALLDSFPSVVPRDIKHLLRLALRMQASKGGDLNIHVFRECATFRAVEIADLPNIPKELPKPRKPHSVRRVRPRP